MIVPLLLVAAALQSEMNPQERKKTGVYKLNSKEQGALQSWIETNYTAKTGTSKKEAPPKSLLEENLYSGSYIRLKDGSTWEIHPDDTPITQSWITPVDISFTPSTGPAYPYALTNTLTQSSVRAKRVDKIPSQNEGLKERAPLK